MFINQQGQPKLDHDTRRRINTHLSKVANERRRPKSIVKVDKSNVQQKRRARAAEEKKEAQLLQDEILMRFTMQNHVRSANLLATDLLTPQYPGQEQQLEVKATYEFLSVVCPTDLRALGMSDVLIKESIHTTISWTNQHKIMWSLLAIYRLCLLRDAEVPGTNTRLLIEQLRSKVLVQINERLAAKAVGDVLILAVSYLIIIDDFLGYIQYGMLHLQGLETMIEMRGGYAAVMRSVTADLHRKIMHGFIGKALDAMKLNSRFALVTDQPIVRYPQPYIGSQLDEAVSKLPVGFQRLAEQRYLSNQTIEVLLEYRQAIADPAHYSNVEILKLWRNSAPVSMNNLEKSIFIAMECLAADLSYGVYQTSMPIWRKTRQRALKVLSLSTLWEVPEIIDCTVWIGSVIMTPTQIDNTPFDLRQQFQSLVIARRPEFANTEEVKRVLEDFFLPNARWFALVQAWTTELQIGILPGVDASGQ